jgi:ADP-heptose:LPS heptosyltransferase
VVQLGAVGDVARTLPAVSVLRAACPGAHLAWLVEPGAASLLAGQPWIDEVIVFPRPAFPGALRGSQALRARARCLLGLRARRFDLVLDFHALLRSALLALATGARRRVSFAPPFARELAWALATDRARLAPERISRFDRNEGLVRFLALEGRPAAHPLRVDPALRAAQREQLGAGPAPIAIHPGTSDAAPHKRFPAPLFGRVARALADATGLLTVVTHGPARDDARLAEAVVAASAGAARLAPATPRLGDLAALLSCARLVIGPDTGPLHVAALVGTPVVQVLGPTDPVENAPWRGTPARVVRARVRDEEVDADSAPGRRADAGRADAEVDAALVARVVAAAGELLGSAASERAATGALPAAARSSTCRGPATRRSPRSPSRCGPAPLFSSQP